MSITLLTDEGIPGFLYHEKKYDLREINEAVKNITGCRSAGSDVVFEGGLSPDNNVYFVFDTETESFVKTISGANLVWEGDDVTTGAYSFQNGVYDYEGKLLVSFPLGPSEQISRLSFHKKEEQSQTSGEDNEDNAENGESYQNAPTRLLDITVRTDGGGECTMLLDLIPDSITRSYYRREFVDLCGVDGFLAEESDIYPEYREYFIHVPGGALRFAWGSYLGEGEPFDTFLDLDGDGVMELICGTEERSGNTRTAYVYQLRDKRIWQGKIRIENGDIRNIADGLDASTFTEYCILPDTAAEFLEWGELDGELFTYKQTLRQIMAFLSEDKDFTLPDGTVLYGQTLLEYNWYDTFCIADIDSDGREELLFTYDPGVMAGMVTVIFDADGDGIKVQGKVWPDSEYYTNGVVLVHASHNQSYGDTIWPYSVLVHDASADGYQVAGSAASMEKTTGEWERKYYIGGEYISFPEELDKDGDGVLYIISEPNTDLASEPGEEAGAGQTPDTAFEAGIQTYDDGTWPVRIVDQDEYDAWIGGYLQGAERIELEWKKFTPENVNAIGE